LSNPDLRGIRQQLRVRPCWPLIPRRYIGELLAGILIGPHPLGLIGTPDESLW
jgi:hypothetical protein